MKNLLALGLLLMGAPIAATAQRSGVEQEVRAFLAAYDKAVSARDVSFLERVLSEDYVLTGASGRGSDRAQVLKYYAQQRDKPSYRRISLKHENVVIRAVNDMAVVTNDYTSQTAPLDAPGAEPETTSGRHTGVLAKRNGRWMVIAEQDTEQPHDDKVMVRQVTKLGRDYFELVKRLADGRGLSKANRSVDKVALSRLLADDYTCACGEGGVTRKPQELARFDGSRIKLDSVQVLEQSVMAIDNNAAVESGTVRYVGRDGAQRMDVTKRYTRTWVAWGQGWQVIAEHTSVSKD